MYLGYLRSAHYAADEKLIYLDYLRSAQYAADEKLPWLSAKRAADEKCTLVFGEAYCALLVKICTMVI